MTEIVLSDACMDKLAHKVANIFQTSVLPQIIGECVQQAVKAVSQPLIAELRELVTAIKNQNSDNGSPQLQSQNLYASVVKALTVDRNLIEDKTTRCVFMGLPHLQTPQETIDCDTKFINDCILNSQQPELLAALRGGSVTTHRHPDYSPPEGKSRPLKVGFPSSTLRDLFMTIIYRQRPEKMLSLPHCYLRRAYTPQELKLDRNLRRQAGQKNSETDPSTIKYVVRNLRIIKLHTPRVRSPLRPITAQLRSTNPPVPNSNSAMEEDLYRTRSSKSRAKDKRSRSASQIISPTTNRALLVDDDMPGPSSTAPKPYKRQR